MKKLLLLIVISLSAAAYKKDCPELQEQKVRCPYSKPDRVIPDSMVLPPTKIITLP